MSAPENKAVFLSYASQDADAARRICDALRAAGVEVWFDQSELRGGDAWDAKIRRQIKECALFVPVISANTQARLEGYFRLEWRLADQRSHLMAKGKAFLLPVAVDETRDADAHVPDSFLEVQWTRLRSPQDATAFAQRVRSLIEGVSSAGRRAADSVVVDAPPDSMPAHGIRKIGLWVGALLALASAVTFVLWPRGRVPPATSGPFKAVAALPSARQAEARELAERARGMRTSLTREQLEAADRLLAQSTEIDPANGETWGYWALVDARLSDATPGGSKSRQSSSRAKAKLALSLAPESYDARLGEAAALVVSRAGDQALKEAERILRQLIEERPEETLPVTFLGRVLDGLGRKEESKVLLNQLAALSPTGARGTRMWKAYLTDFNYREAEEIADQTIASFSGGTKGGAGRSDTGAWLVKLWVTLQWHGDLDRAKALFERAPASLVISHEGVVFGAALYAYRRDAQRSLEVLRTTPDEWIESRYFRGPKTILAATAYRLAERDDATRNAYQSAVKLLEERLSSDPENVSYLRSKAFCLERLGDPRAVDVFRLADQIGGGGPTDRTLEGRLAELERQVKSPDRLLLAARLRLDPAFDEMRAHPRFEALLARLDADPRSNPKALPASVTSPVPAKSVAVLAFRQLSADPENEYLCEAISDELCSVLGRVPGLKVAASASAFVFKKDKRLRPAEMAAQLGVAYLVDGRVQKIGSRVRVGAELIKASDESVVWKSDTLEHEAKDMFAVQDQVVAAIAKNLQLKLGTAAPAVVTINPEAFRLYHEGRQAWSRRTAEGYGQAEELFKRALQVEPRFPRAMVGLADVWQLRDRNTAQAEPQIRAALALDPELAEAHASLGLLLVDQPKRAPECLQALQRAIALNPNYASAHQWLAMHYSTQGFLTEGLAEMQLAAQLDPLSPIIVSNLAADLRTHRRFAEALEMAQRPAAGSAAYTFRLVALLLADLGRPAEGLALLAERASLEPDNAETYRFTRAILLARGGRSAEAATLIEQPGGRSSELAGRLRALAALGRSEALFAELDAVDVTKLPGGVGRILNDLELVVYQEDPRWTSWAARHGLAEAQARIIAWRKVHWPKEQTPR